LFKFHDYITVGNVSPAKKQGINEKNEDYHWIICRQYTDFLCKLNCHDCCKLCWLIWISESVCTWTSLNHEILRWSAARNQNTVATRRVAPETNGAIPPPIPKSSG